MPRSTKKRTSPRVAKGLYANYFEVGHTAFEFVIEFGDRYENSGRSCHTRIVTGPVYARDLLELLTRAIKRYEARFGPTVPAKERRRTTSQIQ